jgi:hypothetical protein
MPHPLTFVRVRDVETKHEFDLPDTHTYIESGLVVLVNDKDYPPSLVARPEKYHEPAPVPARQSAPADGSPQVATEKENTR